MKKICVIVCVIAMLLTFCSCENSAEEYKNISLIENSIFTGESEHFIVTMKGGQKEKPTVIDGVCGKLCPYMNIVLEVKSGYSDKYSYQICINEESFEGDFVEEIVGGNLHAEISAEDLYEDTYKVVVSHGNRKEEILVSNTINKDTIKWNEAKAIAKKELSQSILDMQTEKQANYEIYIKYVYNKADKLGSWYVAFANDKNLSAVLIDAITGKITAKRI